MIFSVIGEELGFIGSMAALLILTLIIIKIVHIGRKSNNMSGSYFCNSMALMIASQTIINVGMCLKLLPTIGIALPFFSAGGSSNLCIYLGIGIVLSVYRAGLETIPVNFRMSHIRTPFSNA
jgi:rod shape determining protein RodA